MINISKNYSLLVMHFIVVLLGFTGVLGKLIDLDSSILVWYRMLFAFGFLVIFIALTKKGFNVSTSNFIKILGIGVVVAAHWLFFFKSIKVSNISVAVVCMATSSLFSAFLEPLFFRRKINYREVIFSVMVIIGLSYAMNADTSYFLGYVYGIIAAFLATLFTILNAVFIKKVSATNITTIEMLAGVLLFTVYFGINGTLNMQSLNLTLTDLYYLLVLGGVCTSFAFVVSVEVMKHLSPYSVIMAVNLEPIYSVILALLIFKDSETMTPSFYIGGLIILITVFLDGYLKAKHKEK